MCLILDNEQINVAKKKVLQQEALEEHRVLSEEERLTQDEEDIYANLITKLKQDIRNCLQLSDKNLRGELETEEEKKRNVLPKYVTTEDFYTWRDHLKIKNTKIVTNPNEQEMDKKVRNILVEATVKESPLLEKIYAWTKFQRIIDFASSKWENDINEMREQGLLDEEFIKQSRIPVTDIYP